MSAQDLLRAIQSNLRQAQLGRLRRAPVHDIYEGFVFSIVLRAANSYRVVPQLRDPSNNPTNRLLLRGSPGRIYVTNPPYTHAVLAFPQCPPLEVHVGVQVQGKSGVLHECDVLALPQSEADFCRQNSVAPRSSNCLVAIECKYYVSSPLSLRLARTFLGLHSDLGLRHTYFVANCEDRAVEALLSFHNRTWENNVLPMANNAAYLEGLLREAFKRYQATRRDPNLR